jgi:hypothetical protein
MKGSIKSKPFSQSHISNIEKYVDKNLRRQRPLIHNQWNNFVGITYIL